MLGTVLLILGAMGAVAAVVALLVEHTPYEVMSGLRVWADPLREIGWPAVLLLVGLCLFLVGVIYRRRPSQRDTTADTVSSDSASQDWARNLADAAKAKHAKADTRVKTYETTIARGSELRQRPVQSQSELDDWLKDYRAWLDEATSAVRKNDGHSIAGHFARNSLIMVPNWTDDSYNHEHKASRTRLSEKLESLEQYLNWAKDGLDNLRCDDGT